MQLITALATPFRQGKVDFYSYNKLLQNQQNVDGVLCASTTGEGGLLSQQEKATLIRETKSALPGTSVWAGISHGATDKAQKEAVIARKNGADGLLVSPPAFFKCTEEGFVKHVLAIKNSVDIPVMLYNAPGRCGYTLWLSCVHRLIDCGVTLLKDAGDDLNYTQDLTQKCTVYCGNEELLPNFISVGAKGAVSVVSNVAPTFTAQVLNNLHQNAQNDTSSAQNYTEVTIFCQLARLAFCQLNPTAIKYMLYKLGIFHSPECRLPLTSANLKTQNIIDGQWKKLLPYLK